MKCNSVLIYYKEPVKGKRKIFGSISPSWVKEPNFFTYWLENNVTPRTKPKLDLDNAVVCDGKIIVNVAAVDEPYFGGSSAELEISYKCAKCGQTYYKELPRYSQELSEWMTKKIAEE